MLVLTFQIGQYAYGIEARLVAEVVPPTVYKQLPRSPKYIKGIFNYRGTITPVVDLSILATDRACKPLMSSRVIVLDLADLDPTEERGKKFLGMIAENITETVKILDSDFESSGLEIPDAPWLGRVARVAGGMLQLVKPDKLLSDELRIVLFSKEEIEQVDR